MEIKAIFYATAIGVEISNFDSNILVHNKAKRLLESKQFFKEEDSNIWKRKSFKNWDNYCFWKDEVEKFIEYLKEETENSSPPPHTSPPPNLEKIGDKIKKLLALSQSPNEAEAAEAMSKAQELLTRYQLSMADLEDNSPEEVEQQVIEETGRSVSWKEILLNAVADANYCMPFIRRGATVKQMMLGRPSNISSAKIQLEYLVGAVDRLASLEDGDRAYKNSFRLGCASRISTRISELVEKQKSEGIAASGESKPISAIVVRSLYEKLEAELDAYAKANLKIKNRTSRPSCRSYEGYFSGMAAGDKVSLNKQVGGEKQKYLPN
ncbi:DUF2786 domain-containing protein [Nostoc linckia]|uniref:DUF2786 domain-containing protein n=1 Tax=Nostoc linckia TaxID=92942 RepID=UPI000BFFE741|nr:DUF2786 domain-containing protein [Nostoc linckia]